MPLPAIWWRRLAWAQLALPVALVLGTATAIAVREPIAIVDGSIAHDAAHTRFGKSESQRRAMFKKLCDGEPRDRANVEREFTETQIWNRNHDSHFHQREWERLIPVGAGLGLHFYETYLILDEGIRAHWPPSPGIAVRADGPPLARTTVPLEQKRVITSTPAPSKAPPAPPLQPSPVVHVTGTHTVPRQ